MVSAKSVLTKLNSLANPKNVAGMARYGITGKQVLGISVYKLHEIAKEIGTNHELALKLWASGVHEARLLAVFIADPERMTSKLMDSWALDFESWDDTDQACTSLFDKTKHAWVKVKAWAKSKELFVKRAAFSLIAGLAVHDKSASDKKFESLFPLIKKASLDDHNLVMKAVSWALRNIGKRNLVLNRKAIIFSRSLLELDSRPARWIARDALRELSSDKVQSRLKKKLF